MPTRTAETRCSNGMSEMASAAPAPTMPSMPGSSSGIGRQHHGDYLGFGEVAFGEERTHGAIDHAAGQHLFLRHAAFAFDVAAGNLTGRVGVFAIVAGERKKALVGFGFRGASLRSPEPPNRPSERLRNRWPVWRSCRSRSSACGRRDPLLLYVYSLNSLQNAGLRSPEILFCRTYPAQPKNRRLVERVKKGGRTTGRNRVTVPGCDSQAYLAKASGFIKSRCVGYNPENCRRRLVTDGKLRENSLVPFRGVDFEVRQQPAAFSHEGQ